MVHVFVFLFSASVSFVFYLFIVYSEKYQFSFNIRKLAFMFDEFVHPSYLIKCLIDMGFTTLLCFF
jgi:hypothetical protein